MTSYICAIDQGTTGTKVIIMDDSLEVVGRVSEEFEQIFPKPSWVEHDPEAIWRSTCNTIKAAVAQAGVRPEEIVAVGITNQRETTVVWDGKTGEAIHNAIVWQDRRTRGRIQQLADDGHEPMVRERTGLILDPYFSGTKIEWILDQVGGARRRAERGELKFGTIDSFLLWRLTGGKVHATDVSNASRTLLMNLHTGEWDEDLLELFRVPGAMLPEIVGNAEVYGHVQGIEGLADGTPICGMAGDQQSALFGQVCYRPGEAKCTYGTGAFLLMNTGDKPVMSRHRLLSTAAWKIDGKMTYALEGSAFIAGALVQWLRDGLGFFETAAEIEELAGKVDSSDGVVLIPSLAGLGAPHWNPGARGVIWGLTRGTTRAHIARAALEAIALQNVDLLKAMEQDLGEELKVLRVDGGASANGLLMQLQADFLNREIVRPKMTDTTALGAALLAGLGAGIFSDFNAIRETWKEDARFKPAMSQQRRNMHLELWEEGLKRV
ncbi:glycerol kinase [Bradymonadaceae bacterium TMQ3]|uniref:Glycerol kinase n=1 Tax=Lujinxingia sediminis TaxID=2480984 RepID=A0ABY0CWC0_9DELT|nr:glycerol kinase GlpK [Lujinxingia sediminis]RDV36701.1 glycerol kinase [Bradymonadaceae bacterium TMQ3]RVU46909.1 glycerol kinase [Lujinxingia sediminis]TXC68520.1 glycerol kinase GlpK [Bradymonadales bacterium TMQ1]